MAFYGMARFAARAARFVGRGLRRIPRPLYRPRRPRVVRRKKTANKVHSFVRLCDKDTLYPGSTGPNTITEQGADQHLAYSFKLDNLVNPSDFTNLYDSYKINKITLHLEPQYDQTQGAGSSGPISRKIRVVHDYNDNDVLTDEDDYLEYSNCKSYSPWSRRGINITLYPKINNIIENVGGSANAFTSQASSKVWLDIKNDEVPHFGIKMFIPGGMLPEDVVMFRVRARYHISLKNSK